MNKADELKAISKDVENDKIATEIREVADAMDKTASLINEGDAIVCQNEIQGLMKGRAYTCGEIVKPNFAVILDEESPIGIYRLDRFTLWNHEV